MITTPQIIGPASDWLRERITEFCKVLENDPWGSDLPGRIVITTDYASALQAYLPEADYEAWISRHQARGDQAKGVGMGFLAADGVPTVVVVALPEMTLRNELLSLICHEICEASMAKAEAGDGPMLGMNEAMSRVLWSEYVVERRRSTIFHERGWPRCRLDDGHLCALFAEYESERPQLLRQARRANAAPDRMYGHWQIMTREFVCSLGRARGGDKAEQAEIEAFISRLEPTGQAVWQGVARLLDEVFECPNAPATDLDELAFDRGWGRIYGLLRAQWNAEYERL